MGTQKLLQDRTHRAAIVGPVVGIGQLCTQKKYWEHHVGAVGGAVQLHVGCSGQRIVAGH